MIQAKYKHPKTSIRKVWVGTYGGHYDIIVFFKSKPKRKKNQQFEWSSEYMYDCLDNKDLIVGDMSLWDFKTLYPDADISAYLSPNGSPNDIEITEVFQMNLEAVWDKYGSIEEYRTHIDW